jgi:type I restriction enzyme, S subunit
MEVKPGYKQTELGVIPEDWDVKMLGSLTSLLTNGFVGTATSAYVGSEDGVLYIQGYNVKENGFDFHGIKRVSKSFHMRNQKSCLQPGDLLTIQTGDVGVTTVVPPQLAGANCHALIISRLNKRVSEPGFYCQYFNSERGRVAFKEIETGTTMKHLNCGDMRRLPLPSPPSVEQRAIATALSDVDALLDGLDRLTAKKRDLKQAAMQQLLTGRTRLPGFKGEWKKVDLATVCSMKSGEGITSVNIDQFSKYPCYGGNGLRGFTSRFTHDGSFALIGRQGALCGNVFGANGKFFASEHAIVVTALAQTDIGYLTFVLGTMNLNQYSESSAQPGLSVSKILKLTISVPPAKTEQTAIARVLTDMEAELAALEARREKTRDVKQGMMQELLPGKTRLV